MAVNPNELYNTLINKYKDLGYSQRDALIAASREFNDLMAYYERNNTAQRPAAPSRPRTAQPRTQAKKLAQAAAPRSAAPATSPVPTPVEQPAIPAPVEQAVIPAPVVDLGRNYNPAGNYLRTDLPPEERAASTPAGYRAPVAQPAPVDIPYTVEPDVPNFWRQLGIGANATLSGLGEVVNYPFNAVAGLFGNPNFFGNAGDLLARGLNLPTPQTEDEQRVSDVVKFLSGFLPMAVDPAAYAAAGNGLRTLARYGAEAFPHTPRITSLNGAVKMNPGNLRDPLTGMYSRGWIDNFTVDRPMGMQDYMRPSYDPITGRATMATSPYNAIFDYTGPAF